MEKKSQILEILSDGSWHDREQLSAQLGISGSELEAQLDSLHRSHPELRAVYKRQSSGWCCLRLCRASSRV